MLQLHQQQRQSEAALTLHHTAAGWTRQPERGASVGAESETHVGFLKLPVLLLGQDLLHHGHGLPTLSHILLLLETKRHVRQEEVPSGTR